MVLPRGERGSKTDEKLSNSPRYEKDVSEDIPAATDGHLVFHADLLTVAVPAMGVAVGEPFPGALAAAVRSERISRAKDEWCLPILAAICLRGMPCRRS